MTLPLLDARLCVACGLCVAVCPTACLADAADPAAPPWLPRPLDCVSCAACAAVCPTLAIRLA